MSELRPFTCPHCGAADIRELGSVDTFRVVQGIDKDGVVIIDGFYEVSEVENGDEKMSCFGCFQTFPMPKKVEYL